MKDCDITTICILLANMPPLLGPRAEGAEQGRTYGPFYYVVQWQPNVSGEVDNTRIVLFSIKSDAGVDGSLGYCSACTTISGIRIVIPALVLSNQLLIQRPSDEIDCERAHFTALHQIKFVRYS